jgi:hypothetical protein
MGFHSLNASILKESYVLSPSTKETRSTPMYLIQKSFLTEKMNLHLYRQLIGKLMQLATCTRPYISYSLSILSQFFSNPARRHWTLARRVVDYLKTTQDSVLFLSSEQGEPVTNSPMTFTDSDFASCEVKRKSKSGACIFFRNSLIYWKSVKTSFFILSIVKQSGRPVTILGSGHEILR